MPRWKAYLLASRPKTLPAAAAPVVVGSAVAFAEGGFHPAPALAALLGALFIQVGTNFVNDVVDYEKGTDTKDRLGPIRVTQAGLLSPGAVKRGAALAFALAMLCGIYLAWAAGWPVVAIGVASILAGIAYTGGPFPLAYNGWGDLFVLVFFGVVAVCGTAFVQLGRVPMLAVFAALPIGALATGILVVNNVRDIPTDRTSGRRTLPVVFGRQAGILEYVALLVLAYVTPVAIAVLGAKGRGSLLALVTLPLGFRLARQLKRMEGPALNRTLAGTALLLMAYALAFSVGVVAGG